MNTFFLREGKARSYALLLSLCVAALFFADAPKAGAQEAGVLTFKQAEVAIDDNPELEALLYAIQPTLYVFDDNTDIYGNGSPLVVSCTPTAVARLYEEDAAYATVKVIRIVEKLPTQLETVDLSQLKTFDNLEYIQLIFAYDACGGGTNRCLLELSKGMVMAGEYPVTVIYQLSIPE